MIGMKVMSKAWTMVGILVLSFFFLWGCAVGPDHVRPTVQVPDNFRGADASSSEASLGDLPWWEVFQDENLQALIAEALENNHDLRMALSRVEQARHLAAQARSQFFPSIQYNGVVGVGRNSMLGNPSPMGGTTEDSALMDLGVLWEVDLWGRIRRLNEAALAQYLATDEARRGITLSLVSGVAQAYFELLELDLSLDIARRNTGSFEETLQIFTRRLEGGVASRLETSTAEGYLGTVAAMVPEIERQIVLKENQINVLVGRNPGPIERGAALLEQRLPPHVPAGLPSTLMERRPDIREAEHKLRAANAQIGVAHADFLPRIGLTTLLGRVSPDLSAFTAGSANMWAVAGTMSGPVFQGGALVAKYRQALAAWEEAKAAYEKAALNAFQEVSNALVSRVKLEEVRVQQSRTVKAYEAAIQVSLQRYVAGKASYYEVLNSQQQLYPAEKALSLTRLNEFLAFVQLYKALGGGWYMMEMAGVTPQQR